MNNQTLSSIDDYIAAQPRTTQKLLKTVRRTIRQAVPEAEETISYRMPAFKLHGRILLYFAGWKQHYSIYPATPDLVAAFKSRLAGYDVNNKGTIRFPLAEPVPTALIAAIAKFRAKDIAARRAAKRSGRSRGRGRAGG